MAVLASKISYPASLGMNSSQTPLVGRFSGALSSQRVPALESSHHAPFASPTESEFSEGFEGSDSVR
jgi:mitogen-activated protein kinase kinase kinase